MFVSTGAGYAPFVGMVHEKEFLQKDASNPYGNIDVYFGCRHSEQDFIYKSEIEKYQSAQIIRDFHGAFSRQDVSQV